MKTAIDVRSPRRSPRGLRIRTQVFLATASLVVVAVAASIFAGTWRAGVVAERTIHDALLHVPRIFTTFRGNLEQLGRDRLRSIAGEPGTKALFASADLATRWEFARELAKQQNARTVFLFGKDSTVLARSDRPQGEGAGQPFATVKWVADVLDSTNESAAAIREGDTLSVVTAVPVFSGDPVTRTMLGVLAASFALDDARAAEIQELTGGEVGFLRNDAKRGERPRLELAAATRALGDMEFVAALNASAGLLDQVSTSDRFDSIGPLDLGVAGDDRLVLLCPIRSASNETLGALTVSRSRTAETAAFREIRATLAGVGLIALIAAIPLSLLIGRGIVRPIEQLVAGAEAIRDGNLDVTLPSGGGEVGALADAFAQMVGTLREKRALERLVADIQIGTTTAEATSAAPVGDGNAVAQSLGATDLRVGEVFAARFQVQSAPEHRLLGPSYRVMEEANRHELQLQILDSSAVNLTALDQMLGLARRVEHQNVLRIFDQGIASGLRFVAHEQAQGTSLRRLLERLGGALALEPGLQIAKQMLRGLAAIHDVGAVHGKLNPHNVVVMTSGTVKLMHVITATDNAGGNAPYRSPEEAAGNEPTRRSDVYSVGAIMFEMFTGVRLPEVAGGTPPRPTSYRPSLPLSVERIILACLERSPDDRPESADAVYAALMRAGA